MNFVDYLDTSVAILDRNTLTVLKTILTLTLIKNLVKSTDNIIRHYFCSNTHGGHTVSQYLQPGRNPSVIKGSAVGTTLRYRTFNLLSFKNHSAFYILYFNLFSFNCIVLYFILEGVNPSVTNIYKMCYKLCLKTKERTAVLK